MVQIASERKVRELERRLDQLKTEAESLRRKGEELRTAPFSIELSREDDPLEPRGGFEREPEPE